MERVSKLVLENQMNSAWYEAVIGVEKESLRVLKDGAMALTNHPTSLGKRSIHPYIQTDFSESQVELITPPFDTIEEMEDWLAALHDVTLRSMEKEEYLWPFSIPGVVPEEEQIPIAKLENEADVRYREFLADTYGKKKQLISGIHVNFEINRTVVDSLCSKEFPAEDYKDFKNQLYVKLAKNYLRYRWLVTYLFGASPVAGENFYSKNQTPLEHPVRSIRSSHYGYVNAEDVDVSFDSLEEYATDILKMVEEGHLSEEREFYSSVRFRGTNSVADLLEKGISYIELRNLDLNPYDEFGLSF
ncbi:MAG: bifunctional glutamate--cysteine ligase/glutathione synthetase, partial [Pisciglobus halotolerans]|nr:bifunctional glutamate--cysteine ligase/glutathione synthetase [Pisciglobus halotolerans]